MDMDGGKDLIFLVDDNSTNLRAGKNVLSEKYSVSTAPSAAKMFSLLEKDKPALILLDIEMPEMNGYEAIKILKSKAETADIPVIFLTGKTDSESELDGLSLGAIDYITKPFVPSLLLKRIEVHLLLKAQQEELKKFNENLQKMVEEETRKVLELHETFGRYLSDEIVKQLLESPEGLALGGKKRFITILLSDIRGFTLISEQMDVEAVVTMLNHYFEILVEVIHRYNGTVIEFLGDGILTVFGAPVDDESHPDKAVACAIEMQLAMDRINRWNQENGFPNLEMGIGINTGETIVGNIGSPRATKYNVVGKNVNLCSRVESYTIGGQIFLSEYTLKAVKAPLNVIQTSEVQPKGVLEPISIYNINAIGEPFNLNLKTEEIPLIVCKKPVPVLCYPIRDKQVEATATVYHVRAISKKEARLIPPKKGDELKRFENIKLCFNDTQVLAKVIDQGKAETTVCFTTSAADILNSILQTF
ncbi:MAG: response regulator [Treponema sp.]|jgi:class 3 adenylate cyclase/CheY-like chemotaxis protein|nr:response regulator [Treponema sp.]